jgi:hypothetical protein
MAETFQLSQKFETIGRLLTESASALSPEVGVKEAHDRRYQAYDYLERLYTNEVYGRADKDQAVIKAWAGLPRDIRPIAMIGKRAVDWWPGRVYGGTFTDDGLPTSSGRANAVPYDRDMVPKLRLAAQQVLAWAGDAAFLMRIVRMGAMLGEVLVEVGFWGDEEQPRGLKVYPNIIHPANVVELKLSSRGDVQSYRIAEWRVDDRGQDYLWGKLVTKTGITTFYNDDPRGFDGRPAFQRHEFGFCPAVWFRHIVGGPVRGLPAVHGIIPTLDEYQGLLSTVDDFIHRFVKQPALIESEDPDALQVYLGQAQAYRRKGIPTSSFVDPNSSRQAIGIKAAPAGTRVHHLIENLGLDAANEHIDRVKKELEKALPEIVLWEQMLEMDQVTYPGAMPLVQQVQMKLDESVNNYDKSLRAILQMCIAIGGYLIAEGEWGLASRLTKDQKKLQGYDLDSFDAGKLDFTIQPRELIPESYGRKVENATAFEMVRTPSGLRMLGLSDEEIYGAGLVPETKPGILQERSTAAPQTSTVGSEIERLFQSGFLGEEGQTPQTQEPVAVGGQA